MYYSCCIGKGNPNVNNRRHRWHGATVTVRAGMPHWNKKYNIKEVEISSELSLFSLFPLFFYIFFFWGGEVFG